MEPLRVLVVDDEAELVSAVVERLEIRGFAAQGALTGAEALELVRRQTFDVVVLDVKMPGLGGLQVIKQLKRDHPSLQVILLTGHGSAESAREGMQLGAFDYLMKPINIDDLVKILHQAAGR
jgi:two-component system OmpR family response regulator